LENYSTTKSQLGKKLLIYLTQPLRNHFKTFHEKFPPAITVLNLPIKHLTYFKLHTRYKRFELQDLIFTDELETKIESRKPKCINNYQDLQDSSSVIGDTKTGS
jgi:hypothetical protein